MLYKSPTDDLLCTITYGSRLYGTQNANSDTDFKCVYLPPLRDLLLCKQPKTLRFRFDDKGQPVGDHATMPPGGYEAEHTPVQKFVHDFLGGQAYAVELVFAVMHDLHEQHLPPVGAVEYRRALAFEGLCRTLAMKYVHRNVTGMVGFAMKQTFDYVRRGERLKMAQSVVDVVEKAMRDLQPHHTAGKIRLDTTYNEFTVLDVISQETGLTTGLTENNGIKIRTLELNGRSYLATTELRQFSGSVKNLISEYGTRSTNASAESVDWKSLSHAVRVYEQVIELLTTKFITFPRPNADYLRMIKEGTIPVEDVKESLRVLDDIVMNMIETSSLPKSDEIRDEVDELLFRWMKDRYG